ncbi:DUF4326 domain-containing protein [Kitasatospora sp. NPDC048722]|uniref:DUF4326 domain-containing protein n=1 Tax=Kitasatospora sp. NPDC048722 TaxID=3155639 RepID=UPI00340936A3
MNPTRIQRRRIRGWRAPEGVVYVGRGSRWGNPWAYRTRTALARVPALDGSAWEIETRISSHDRPHPYRHPDGRITDHHVRYMTRAECVELYRTALIRPTDRIRIPQGHDDRPRLTVEDVRRELAGRDLMCWCPPTVECHADVLLAIANGPEEYVR